MPDYLEGYLDLERFIFVVLILFLGWAGYRTYHLNSYRSKIQTRSYNFADKLPTYQKLRKKVLRKQPPETNEDLKKNPLSYLEQVIPDQYLTNLKPIDDGNQEYRYQLKIESTDISTIMNLLADFEERSPLKIVEFTVVRKSIKSLEFHVVYTLQLVV